MDTGENTPHEFIYIQHKIQMTVLLTGGSQRSGDRTDRLITGTGGLWWKWGSFLPEGVVL